MEGTIRRAHFVAIGGTGMGSLAGLLKARGLEITGSDTGVYPPMSTALERWKIPVREGFAAEHIAQSAPDLVVIGNAVRPDNPEAQAALDAADRGELQVRSFPDALYELAMAHKHPIVAAGTHGKTTTTSLTAYLLHATGRDPSLLVGGISLDFDGSFREGEGEHFVVEGDEYDTVFFDKTPKFLHYHPRTLILTSVEFDHADIYRDLDHVKSAFRTLVERMPDDGAIAAAWDHPNVRDVLGDAPCRVLRYATQSSEAEFLARNIEAFAGGTRFDLVARGGATLRAQLPMHGVFNVENALGALVAVHAVGVPLAESLAALPGFRGVKRRQELRGSANGVRVYDDFAHHPTAVRGSIEALRARHPEGALVAVFEPRTNTSRRAVFQDDYARAFDGADRVIVKRVPDEPIYSATGEVSELFSADQLVDALRARGLRAEAHDEIEQIVAALAQDAKPGDTLLTMSNGAFGGIWEKLLEALEKE